jgi:hypothetical protein
MEKVLDNDKVMCWGAKEMDREIYMLRRMVIDRTAKEQGVISYTR